MKAKITVISKEENHEIIKIEYGANSKIVYAYIDKAIILNGDISEPYLIGIVLREELVETIKNHALTRTLSVFLDTRIGYKIHSFDDLYHISKAVISLVNKYCESNNPNKFTYSGERVSMNKETKTFDFKFPGRTISIPVLAIVKLLSNPNTIWHNDGLEVSIRKNRTDRYNYIICETICDKYYIKMHEYMELNAIDAYSELLNNICHATNKIFGIIIKEVCTIKCKAGKFPYNITVSTSDLYDLANGQKNAIKASIELLSVKIECIINTMVSDGRVLIIEVHDIDTTIGFYLNDTLYQLFKQAALNKE